MDVANTIPTPGPPLEGEGARWCSRLLEGEGAHHAASSKSPPLQGEGWEGMVFGLFKRRGPGRRCRAWKGG
jgi:hypothetical protein